MMPAVAAVVEPEADVDDEQRIDGNERARREREHVQGGAALVEQLRRYADKRHAGGTPHRGAAADDAGVGDEHHTGQRSPSARRRVTRRASASTSAVKSAMLPPEIAMT